MASRADGKSLRAGFAKCMRRREDLPASLGQGKVALAENEAATTPYDRPVGLISRRNYEQSYTALPGASAARPTGVSLGRSKTKRAPCLGGRRRPAAEPFEQAHCKAHELIVAGCEPILGDPNIVFHAGAHSISPTFQRPSHCQRLMAANTGPALLNSRLIE